MPTDLERLVVSLEARTNAFEKAMNKAMGVSNSRAKAIENRWKKLNLGNSFFLNFSKGAVAALLPTLSLAAAIKGAKGALEEFGRISDDAKASGIDSELFQGLAYAAQQGGVAYDQFSGSLATFAKNAGLAVAHKGRMYSALKVLNPELLKNIQAATTQEERIRLATDAIAKESDASRRAALSTTLFGDAGAKLADVFRGGSQSIDEWLSKARRIGIVVDRDLIARADDMGDAFDTATKILDLQFKEILVELAPLLISTAQAIADIVRALKGLGSADPFSGVSTEDLKKHAAELDDIANPKGMFSIDFFGGSGRRLAEVQSEIANRSQAPAGTAPPAFDFRKFLNQTTVVSDFTDPDEIDQRDRLAEAAEREADRVRELIEELKFENSLIGKSELEQERLRAVRQAGAAATDAQRESIARLTEEGYRHNAAIEAQQELYEELGSIGKAAVQGIVDAMRDGKVEGQELLGIVTSLLDRAAGFFLDQAFSGGNILGSLFGGGNVGSAFRGGWGSVGLRANGGPVTAGQPYIVGERQAELFVPNQNGMIIPKVPGRSTSAGGLTINFAPVIDARGMDPQQLEQRLTAMARFEIPAIARKAMADPHATG